MNLFDRLPAGLFGPLTGVYHRRAWDLLVRLSQRFFGADCVPPYAEGYLHEQVVKEIERFLLDHDWPEQEAAATPINVQANQWLARLVDTGWLIEDRVGLRLFISMRPVVARFFDTLEQFALDGPQLVGGSIQVIYNQLKSVQEDPQRQAAGFQTAAQLCSRLINSLNATTLRVRDLIRDLTQEQVTPIFVKRFFSEHIEELYVRDFRQMRTENHPLMLRFEIIELVETVATAEPARGRLIAGYRELPGARLEAVEETLARDVARFQRLLDVEKFLERMDRVIDSATQRALAYLGYRLKASERLEDVLADTVASACKLAAQGGSIEGRLLSPAPLIADYRLRMPNMPAAKPARRAMVRREMTARERAELFLRRAMVRHRDTTPAALRRYVLAHLAPGSEVEGDQLPVRGVDDAVAILVLMRLAAIGRVNPKALRANPLLRNLDFDAVMEEGRRMDTGLFELPRFKVKRRAGHAA
ncbi:MAG: hypothetical protein KF686_20190 [Ramlibacter sp.]|nr:hypothetical protein [Ramlibacter sp.]